MFKPARISYISAIETGTMTGALSRFNKSRALPLVALISCFFLVAGQVFNCCRLNEIVSSEAGLLLKSWVLFDSHSDEAVLTEASGSHPGCHGHGKTEGPAVAPPLLETEGATALSTQQRNCISEFAFAAKSQLPGSSFFLLDFPGKPYILPALAFGSENASAERPRPQNRSSPPVYLLTLRIL